MSKRLAVAIGFAIVLSLPFAFVASWQVTAIAFLVLLALFRVLSRHQDRRSS